MYFIVCSNVEHGEYFVCAQNNMLPTDKIIRGPFVEWEKAVQEMANLDDYLLPPIPADIPEMITSIPL